jgi:ammonia channel protein AmtB
MLMMIDMITPVRVTDEAEAALDVTLHGESAYID